MGDAHYNTMRLKHPSIKKMNHLFYNKIFSMFFKKEADCYVSLGDLTHFGRKKEFQEIYSIIEKQKREDQDFVQVFGNHDVLFYSQDDLKAFTKRDRYFAKHMDEANLIFLDTSKPRAPFFANSRLDKEQADFLAKELERSKDKLVFVFGHHPAYHIPIQGEETLTVYDLLRTKKDGFGVYVHGHKHKDKFSVEDNWGFLQFNDLLDEPSIRVLEVEGDRVAMDTIALGNLTYLHYAEEIAKNLLTFPRTRNDEEYAGVRQLSLLSNSYTFSLADVIETDDPYFSVDGRGILNFFLSRFVKQ